MAKIEINTQEAKPVEKTTPDVKSKETKLSEQIAAYLTDKKEEGATAHEMALAFGLIDKDSDKPTLKAAERKIRALARKVVDQAENGARTVRNQRNRVYQILS